MRLALPTWRDIADRAVDALGVQRGELIQVREHSGRPDVVLEMALAIERAGATPLPELTPPDYLHRLLCEGALSYLAAWDRHRIGWLQQVDRVLVLDGPELEQDAVPAEAFQAWRASIGRLVDLEDARRLPYLLVAVPTARRAADLGVPLPFLEEQILPALAIQPAEFQQQIGRVLPRVEGGQRLTLRSDPDAELRMTITGRRWLSDDGRIAPEDRAAHGHVGNLPAGSAYTTVLESSPDGTLRLPRLLGAEDVRLTFRDGRIADVTARSGRDRLLTALAGHSGDPDRISHVGVGLNPSLNRFMGWPLVDEHVLGALFVALGENRYLGGENASSLNVDVTVANATLFCDGRPIVEDGRLRV